MSVRKLVWTSIGTLLLLFLLAGAGLPWVLDVVIRLLGGWVSYLATVGSKITVDGGGIATLLVCLLFAAVLGHGFCAWLWRGTGHEGPWRARWTAAGLSTVVLLFACGMAFTGVAHQVGWLLRSREPLLFNSGRASNDRNASSSLKTVATAQADFRANDRDGNRIQEYWRADIAGLYALKAPGDPVAIKLIELSMALADADPKTPIEEYGPRAPKAGYLYRALRYRGETLPDPDRYAACAYPSSPDAGRWMFVINEKNTVFRKAFTEAGPPDVFPEDLEKEGWSKLD